MSRLTTIICLHPPRRSRESLETTSLSLVANDVGLSLLSQQLFSMNDAGRRSYNHIILFGSQLPNITR